MQDFNSDSCLSEINLEDQQETTPKDIADIIFSKPAGDPYSCQLIISQEDNDYIYIHEMLISVLLEALNNFLDNKLREYDQDSFSEDILLYFEPWFRSLGFMMFINKYNISDKEMYSNYYCRVVINNKNDSGIFEINNLTHLDYHFLLNGHYVCDNKELKDVSSIFKCKDDVYNIRFELLK